MAGEQCTSKTLDCLINSKLKESYLKVFNCPELNTSGLIDDKQSILNDEGSSVSVDSVVEVVIDEDDVLNDDEIDAELIKISNIGGLKLNSKSIETDITSKPLKRRKFQIVRSEKKIRSSKKIVLNRCFLTDTKSEIADIKATNDNSAKKKVIKLSDFSLKQRLEMRAEKFGVPLTQDAKKQIRAHRFSNNSMSSNKTTIELGNRGNKATLLKKRAERFGIISTQFKILDTQERLEKRKERFGVSAPASEDKKAKISKRFKQAGNEKN